MENYFLSGNQPLVILTALRVEIKVSLVCSNGSFWCILSQKLLDGLFHQTRGNQERSHELQDTGYSIQGPKTFPQGRWGKLTQDSDVEQAWRTGVHIGWSGPGETWWGTSNWHWGATCAIRIWGYSSDRFLRIKQNEMYSSLTSEKKKRKSCTSKEMHF